MDPARHEAVALETAQGHGEHPLDDVPGLLPYAEIVRPGGRIVSPVAQGAEQALEGRPVSARVVAGEGQRAGELGALAASGDLAVRIEAISLDDAERAIARQATRRVPGKLVLVTG